MKASEARAKYRQKRDEKFDKEWEDSVNRVNAEIFHQRSIRVDKMDEVYKAVNQAIEEVKDSTRLDFLLTQAEMERLQEEGYRIRIIIDLPQISW